MKVTLYNIVIQLIVASTNLLTDKLSYQALLIILLRKGDCTVEHNYGVKMSKYEDFTSKINRETCEEIVASLTQNHRYRCTYYTLG